MSLKQIGVGVYLRLMVSAGFVIVLFYFLPIDDVVHGLSSLAGYVWLQVVVAFIVGHVVAAYKWRYILRSVGVAVDGISVVRAHGAGLFANIWLPSIVGGDVVRATMIVRSRSDIENVVVAGVFDRIVDVIALLMIAVVACMFVDRLPVIDIAPVLMWFVIILLFVVLFVVYVGNKYLSNERVSAVLRKVKGGCALFLSNPFAGLFALGLSLSIQCLFIGLNIYIAYHLGIDVPIAVWFLCWPVAKIVALAPVSLGGLGVRDAALVMLLAFYGVASGFAFAQSIAWQVTLFVGGVLAGIFSLVASANIRRALSISSMDELRGSLDE